MTICSGVVGKSRTLMQRASVTCVAAAMRKPTQPTLASGCHTQLPKAAESCTSASVNKQDRKLWPGFLTWQEMFSQKQILFQHLSPTHEYRKGNDPLAQSCPAFTFPKQRGNKLFLTKISCTGLQQTFKDMTCNFLEYSFSLKQNLLDCYFAKKS